MDDWFLVEFGPYGFRLSPTIYNPDSFSPTKKVIHPDGFPTPVMLTPELADDLRGWGISYEYMVETYKDHIRQTLSNMYPEVFGSKDFSPKQRLEQFKF